MDRRFRRHLDWRHSRFYFLRYRPPCLLRDHCAPVEERSQGCCCGMARGGPVEAGRPHLLRHVGSSNATHYVRRFLTPLLGVPIATEEMEEEDSQGTLTLWFHENKDKDGNPSSRVYRVSNCHILRKNTTMDYEHRGGARMDYVRVSRMCRFQRGLDEIMKAIADHGILADLWAREIVKLQAKERQDAENKREIRANRRKLDDENEAIADLEALYNEVIKDWSNIKLHRNIGHVQYAAAISVDVEGGTLYTSDWAAFLAAEAKVKDEFEGNVVDLGAFRLLFSYLPRLTKTTLFRIQVFSSRPYRYVLSSRWWSDHVQVSRGEKAQDRGLRRKKISPRLQSSTAKASAALSSAKTATLPTSPSDATPAWFRSLRTKSASSPSSSVSTTRATRLPKYSPLKETRAPSSGTRGMASSHRWPTSCRSQQRRLDQQPCYLLHPWLVPPGPDQEAIPARHLLPHHLVNLKVRLFLPPHHFVHIADNVEACALASRSTVSSSATSYLPLCPLLFLSVIVLVSWTHPPSLTVTSSPALTAFSPPVSFYCLLFAPWLLVQTCVFTVDSLFTFVPFFRLILSC